MDGPASQSQKTVWLWGGRTPEWGAEGKWVPRTPPILSSSPWLLHLVPSTRWDLVMPFRRVARLSSCGWTSILRESG